MNNNKNNKNIVPIVSYRNADISKCTVLYENKGKFGIKHSEATKKLLSDAFKGRTFS